MDPSTGSGQVVTTNYTLDLAAGLTQILNDGTNTYLYGNGRIAQAGSTTEYFLGDALGSVRQLAGPAGAVTLTQSYAPYGEVTQSVGTSQTSYAFTGENLDASGLTYLRARYLDSSIGRFTQRDPSALEANLYLYAGANPVNRMDPTGLFSIENIAKSYGFDEPQLVASFWNGLYNRELQGRWGWLKLLLDAKDGQAVQVGAPAMFPPFLTVSRYEQIYSDGCNNIFIGGKTLNSYTSDVLGKSMQPLITWRSTKPSHYYLDDQEYLDAGRMLYLPDFYTINLDVLSASTMVFKNPKLKLLASFSSIATSATVDRYGNVYFTGALSLSPSISPPKGLPLSFGEGYINRWPPQPHLHVAFTDGHITIPSEGEISGTLTKGCFEGGLSFLETAYQGSICGGGSLATLYGYDMNTIIGTSVGYSYTFMYTTISELKWDYIEDDAKPGISKQDIFNEIGW